MSNIVNGYTGIIAPPNLATNGAFTIDQRGNFKHPGTFFPVKHGDYLVDCWYVSVNTNVDYLSARNSHDVVYDNHNHLGFKGYGKKGQIIKIANRDTGMFGQLGETFQGQTEPAREMYTASIKGHVPAGDNIPVKIEVSPRFRTNTTNTNEVYSYSPVVTYEKQGEAVSVWKGTNDTSVNIDRSDFIITLQEDGEFEVWVQCFRLFAGAYKNPPKYAPVPYADDFARCQRYYQTGTSSTTTKATQANTNHARYAFSVDFATEMATIPTLSLTHKGAFANDGVGSNSDREGYMTNAQNNIFPNMFECIWDNTEATYASNMINYGVHSYLDWTAEVV